MVLSESKITIECYTHFADTAIAELAMLEELAQEAGIQSDPLNTTRMSHEVTSNGNGWAWEFRGSFANLGSFLRLLEELQNG